MAKENINKSTGKTGMRFSFDSLVTRMIGAFLVMIVLILLLGIGSYIMVKRTINSQVKDSLTNTVSAEGSYLELGLQQIDNRMVELIAMDEMIDFYLNPNLDIANVTSDQIDEREKIRSRILNLKTVSDFVYHVYLISDVATGITTASTRASLTVDFYDRFTASEEGTIIAEASEKFGYMGRHQFLEDFIEESEANFPCSDYAFSLWRKVDIRNNLILVVDINKDTIFEILSELDNGAGSYAIFVTPDGRETVYHGGENGGPVGDGTAYITGTSFYHDALASEETEGYREVRWEDESYVFSYSKVGTSGAMLAVLVPTSHFLSSTQGITTITFIMVLAAFAIALIMCVLLSRSLKRGVNDITKSLDRAAQGDFTVSLKVKRRDEFGQIAASIDNMIAGVRALIVEVKGVMETVKNASELVGGNTSRLIDSNNEISQAIGEIEHGANTQAEDSQDCVRRINQLSDQIDYVYKYTDEISRISEDANRTISEGMDVINDLSEKSGATVNITDAIRKDMISLNDQTQSIAGFADLINEIASQTNLLSLNASIEAARAGEAGRGFSVVAEEIRNLADQSLKAAEQIGGIVEEIRKQTGQTVDSVLRAGEIVESQSGSLNNTRDAFHKVYERMQRMVEDLSQITGGMSMIENTSKETVDAIMNISAVSEENSANSGQVENNVERQKEFVEELHKTVALLEEKATRMEETVSRLRV